MDNIFDLYAEKLDLFFKEAKENIELKSNGFYSLNEVMDIISDLKKKAKNGREISALLKGRGIQKIIVDDFNLFKKEYRNILLPFGFSIYAKESVSKDIFDIFSSVESEINLMNLSQNEKKYILYNFYKKFENEPLLDIPFFKISEVNEDKIKPKLKPKFKKENLEERDEHKNSRWDDKERGDPYTQYVEAENELKIQSYIQDYSKTIIKYLGYIGKPFLLKELNSIFHTIDKNKIKELLQKIINNGIIKESDGYVFIKKN